MFFESLQLVTSRLSTHSLQQHGERGCASAAAGQQPAEGQFVLRNVNDELIRYYNVLTALPEATINFVVDFVEAPLPADPYTQLPARLLAAHQLTDYQKVEFIKKMPSLGAQKPSELSPRCYGSAPGARRATSSSSTSS